MNESIKCICGSGKGFNCFRCFGLFHNYDIIKELIRTALNHKANANEAEKNESPDSYVTHREFYARTLDRIRNYGNFHNLDAVKNFIDVQEKAGLL